MILWLCFQLTMLCNDYVLTQADIALISVGGEARHVVPLGSDSANASHIALGI
jgi:hypothetical protein